uniref:Reverse transcriptase domain-containing protein n=1 Tax=Tanacetum cinerariifolium TaxID=118510 RepID=A0A6L2MUV9_TANCI|nr:reverse transcriptase domain-containing protein [Tanacetum cinerariifolium]
MRTHASNSELVERLPKPERTLNRRLCRRNRRVPFDQRNNPPQHPRIVYPPILNINYFCHFLDILRNYDPMDDEPMWAVDCVVTPTPSFAITIHETANEFAIKEIRAFSQHENESLTDAWLRMKEMLRDRQAGGIFLYKTPNQAYQLLEDKVLLKLDWAKNRKTKSSLKKTAAFTDKELQSHAKQPTPDLDDDDMPMSREEEAKFMKTFQIQKIPFILGRHFLYTADAIIRVKQKQLILGVGTGRMIFNIDSAMKHPYTNDDTYFSIDVINEILEEDFDALLGEGSKILHFVEGTLLE